MLEMSYMILCYWFFYSFVYKLIKPTPHASLYFNMLQLLLERGARVEGSWSSDDDNFTETPLQIAVAAGINCHR